jgi:hypothetical protein
MSVVSVIVRAVNYCLSYICTVSEMVFPVYEAHAVASGRIILVRLNLFFGNHPWTMIMLASYYRCGLADRSRSEN